MFTDNVPEDAQIVAFCERLERERNAARADAARLRVELWVLAEWVRFLMGLGSSVLCGVGGVLGLPCQRVGDVRPAVDADAVVVLLMVAVRLLPVEPRGLSASACVAVRCAAVAQAAAKERAG